RLVPERREPGERRGARERLGEHESQDPGDTGHAYDPANDLDIAAQGSGRSPAEDPSVVHSLPRYPCPSWTTGGPTTTWRSRTNASMLLGSPNRPVTCSRLPASTPAIACSTSARAPAWPRRSPEGSAPTPSASTPRSACCAWHTPPTP